MNSMDKGPSAQTRTAPSTDRSGTASGALWSEREQRQMGRDVIRMASMVAGGRIEHRYPVDALIGVNALLATAKRRHRRYWGRRG